MSFPSSTNQANHHGRALRLLVFSLALVSIGFAFGVVINRSGFLGSGRREDSTGSATGAAGEGTPKPAGTAKKLYTCGMHPEVISDEPGICPKCEMKLTPMDPDRAKMILEARGEKSAGDAASGGERKIKFWRSPMDPAYVRNAPGKDAMGHDLAPVYEDEIAGGPTITIDPVTEQNMGLRYDVVRVGPLEKAVRTVGNVEYDESGQGAVTTKVEGWVEKIHVDQTGTQVHKGDALFDLYAPQLFSAQQEYLVALKDANAAADRGNPTATQMARQRLESARGRLRYFDINDEQIKRLEQEGEPSKTLTISSQLTGIVTEKMVTQGSKVMPNEALYKIADLSTVWVVGKVFESDLPFVKLGQEAFMRLDYLPGRVYKGRVTYIYPYLQPGTREVPVRVEFHNPGYDLKPGMYATIELASHLDDKAVLIPRMAVLDTGQRKVAFVMREAGKFEPRQLTLGAQNGENELQVLSGVAPGEKVVVSGQFLLDSESRLREATLKMLGTGLQNTNRILEKSAAERHADHPTTTAQPGTSQTAGLKFVCPMPSHSGILYEQAGDCPLCGMKLIPVQQWQEEATSPVDHYICPMPEHYDVRLDKPGKCPKCGMTLIPVTQEEIKRFAKAEAEGQKPETIYTCPMPSHAQVASDKPGDCPECGMKLVPAAAVPHGKQAEAQWRKDHPHSGSGALTLYTCPMEEHAHVVSDNEGRCPECNMKLVPTSEVKHGTKSEEQWKKDHPGGAPTAQADQSTTATTATQGSVTPQLYTCPMEEHAHIVSDKPGDCPECGMELVPTSEVKHKDKAEANWRGKHGDNASTPKHGK